MNSKLGNMEQCCVASVGAACGTTTIASRREISVLVSTRSRPPKVRALHSEFDEHSFVRIGTYDNAVLPCLLNRRNRLPKTKIQISGQTPSVASPPTLLAEAEAHPHEGGKRH
jgi:hypothetical protein